MGKTAGDKFLYLMNKYYQKDIIFQHKYTDPNKHNSLREQSLEYSEDVVYLLGFRKLHNYIVSHNNHQYRHQHHHNKSIKLKLEDLKEYTKKGICVSARNDIISTQTPDQILNKYHNPDYNYDFIRQEFFYNDFMRVTEKYLYKNNSINDSDVKKIDKIWDKHVTADMISEEELVNIYSNNPNWKKLQDTLYA